RGVGGAERPDVGDEPRALLALAAARGRELGVERLEPRLEPAESPVLLDDLLLELGDPRVRSVDRREAILEVRSSRRRTAREGGEHRPPDRPAPGTRELHVTLRTRRLR